MKKILSNLYNIIHPFLLVVVFLFFMLFITPQLKTYMNRLFKLQKDSLILENLSFFIHLVLIFLVYAVLPKTIKSNYSFRALDFKTIMCLVFISLAGFLIIEILINHLYSKNNPGQLNTLSGFVGEKIKGFEFFKYTNGSDFIGVVFFQPIIEEMYFRYFMNLPYNTKGWFIYGFIISTMLFTILHGYRIATLIRVFTSGVILFLIFILSKNILRQ